MPAGVVDGLKTGCLPCRPYIAAMVQELQIMSAQANCQTLAGLLELAHREAVRQRYASP